MTIERCPQNVYLRTYTRALRSHITYIITVTPLHLPKAFHIISVQKHGTTASRRAQTLTPNAGPDQDDVHTERD